MKNFFEYQDAPGVEGGGGGSLSTHDIIASSIESLDRGADEPVDEGVVTHTQNADADHDDVEEKEIAKLQAEWKAKNPTAKGNIAIDRHQAVLTRTRNQHAKALEEWAAKEKAWQESEKKYKGDLEGWGQYEWAKDEQVHNALRALALSEENPAEFAKLLLSDDRYAKILKMVDAPVIPSNRPKPNAKTEDGSLEYYDNEGLGSLLDWQSAQIKKDLTESLTAQIREEMKKEYGDVADAYKASTLWNEELVKAKSELDHMRKEWKGFAEFEGEIKALMNKREEERKTNRNLPALNVRDAYIQLVPAKLEERQKVNEAALKDKWIQEQKEKKAAAGGVVETKTGVERSGEKKERSTRDIIAAQVAKLRE